MKHWTSKIEGGNFQMHRYKSGIKFLLKATGSKPTVWGLYLQCRCFSKNLRQHQYEHYSSSDSLSLAMKGQTWSTGCTCWLSCHYCFSIAPEERSWGSGTHCPVLLGHGLSNQWEKQRYLLSLNTDLPCMKCRPSTQGKETQTCKNFCYTRRRIWIWLI